MSLKSKSVILAITCLISIAVILETVFLMYGWGVLAKIVCYGVSALGIILGALFFFLKKDALFKTCFILVVCAFIVVTCIGLISKLSGLNDYNSDGDKIARLVEIIKGTGSWGKLVFVIIQILQVLILPLPAVVCYVPGTQIWGALTATLLASLGVFIGSVIAYFIGKVFGRRVVVWIAGDETVDKYAAYIGSRGKFIFLLMQILPFFPDDVLCMIAGLSAMNFPFFIATIAIIRPMIIAAYCYLGTGSLIPFSGWGIYVWIAIFIVCIALALLSLKYQDRVEKWLVSKFKKKEKPAEPDKEDKEGSD